MRAGTPQTELNDVLDNGRWLIDSLSSKRARSTGVSTADIAAAGGDEEADAEWHPGMTVEPSSFKQFAKATVVPCAYAKAVLAQRHDSGEVRVTRPRRRSH